MLESEADRLEMIRAVGGEPFDTGQATKLWGIFDRPSFDENGTPIPVKNRKPQIECRESDVVLHGLVKESALTRDADGSKWFCKDFEPDGTGMTVVMLRA